jgi:hypothetical protein
LPALQVDWTRALAFGYCTIDHLDKALESCVKPAERHFDRNQIK